MMISQFDFGRLKDGSTVEAVDVENSWGLRFRFLTLGGIIASGLMPDQKGAVRDIVLGSEDLSFYERPHPYFGALVGRVANRIKGSSFELAGERFSLASNDTYAVPPGEAPRNHLHGGTKGFSHRSWSAKTFQKKDEAGVVLSLFSPHGEEGYPGNLKVQVRYSLNEAGELAMDFTAETDRITPVNLCNHAYWNLAGAGSGTINNHHLTLACSHFLEVDQELIPTGKITEAAGTPLDFQQGKIIGNDLSALPGGYDHCFTSPNPPGETRILAAVVDPKSGRGMEVRSTKPAIQFYGGNFLDGSFQGPQGRFEKHGGFCLETEHYPDAVHHSHFPTCLVKPGEIYHHSTVHRFYLEKT